MAGEAQARVVEVTAEATAKQTTLEGNAEAGIVLSKGEAEAKALALRAEAYRQFNEAAIIQTVLSMLPDIVRAAAEPMSHIDQLTVLSNDGASDMVKNVTRTVTEAGATVKGLTGIDIPELLNEALGSSGESSKAASSKPRPTAPPRSGGTPGSAPPAGGGAAMAGGTTTGATTASPARSTGATATGLGATPPAPTTAPPRFDSPEAVDAALADADRALRAAAATTSSAARTDTAAGPARPASADITRATTVDDAARRLASDLRSVPGIERFGAVRLAELERGGPRPLRTMWRVAREQLGERYGQMTIGELIDQYGSQRGPSA